MVRTTGTGKDRQDPLSTTAKTVVLPEVYAEGFPMLPVISEFSNQSTLKLVPPLIVFSTVVRSKTPVVVSEQSSIEAGFAAGVPGETPTLTCNSSVHPCASVTVTS